jgi:hypothetical protein
VERAFSDIVASMDVQFSLVLEARVVASSVRRFAWKPDFIPVLLLFVKIRRAVTTCS